MRRTWGLVLAGMACLAVAWAPAAALALPANFTDSTVFSGLRLPISVAFAPDGRIFVAEKGGTIEVFAGPTDTTPTTFADLRTEIFGGWDRGLEAIAIDPQFPARPYIYASYTYDAPIGGTAPTWGAPGQDDDDCPGATSVGCVVSGRLSRLTVANNGAGNTMSNERVLINDWCQQFTSHSVGDLGFDAAGNLYMSGGDGAEYNTYDYGQFGQPSNPCGDPPGGVGGTQTAATGEGGALRSQDYRTAADPLGLDGTVIRVNPDTGRPVPDIAGNDPSALNTARVVAFGFRNPFRFAIRPGTNPAEIWTGDVGWGTWEEINRVQTQAGAASNNFGWPCVEGAAYRVYYEAGFCQSLYAAGGDRAPYYGFEHGEVVDPAETSLQPRPCVVDSGSAISGLEFYDDGSGAAAFPAAYDGSLFFADYARGCIWVMRAGANGLPNPANVTVFDGAGGPVDLEVAPDGSLWYAGITTGQVHRIAYAGGGNRPPIARATATPDHGVAPLQVQLSASSSSDPDGDPLSYAWDLDDDGAFDDSTAASPVRTFTSEGAHRVRVRVSDPNGASAQDEVTVTVGAPPTPVISSPANGARFDAFETISFSGSASDTKDGAVPASRLRWTAVLNHCIPAGGCHVHPIRTFGGVSGGQLEMPAHERPYHLTLTLTATDSDGLEASVSRDIYPKPNVAPLARASAAPDHGRAPLVVAFDASGSTDANPGDQLSYAWDLDGDGAFDDSTAVSPTRTYTTAGVRHPAVEVSDQNGASSRDALTVTVTGPDDNQPPEPRIDLPATGTGFAAHDRIPFAGGADDAEDGALPASALRWRLIGPDCRAAGCAGRLLADGADHGELAAPASVDPYELRLRLIATDSAGATASTEVALEPRVARLTIKSRHEGARVSIGEQRGRVPFARTVLQGADVRVRTPALQRASGSGRKARLRWRRWSDGGDRVHTVRLNGDAVLRAGYRLLRRPRGR
ncbi:MAG: PKD domain-containing protein [Solirubrobacterales bacterium]